MVQCMLRTEDGRTWRRAVVAGGLFLVGAACSGLLAAGSVCLALEAVGRVAGCGRGAVDVGLGGWGFYLPFPSPFLLPAIFLSLVVGLVLFL